MENNIISFREISIGEINLIASKNFAQEIKIGSKIDNFSLGDNKGLLLFNKTSPVQACSMSLIPRQILDGVCLYRLLFYVFSNQKKFFKILIIIILESQYL